MSDKLEVYEAQLDQRIRDIQEAKVAAIRPDIVRRQVAVAYRYKGFMEQYGDDDFFRSELTDLMHHEIKLHVIEANELYQCEQDFVYWLCNQHMILHSELIELVQSAAADRNEPPIATEVAMKQLRRQLHDELVACAEVWSSEVDEFKKKFMNEYWTIKDLILFGPYDKIPTVVKRFLSVKHLAPS